MPDFYDNEGRPLDVDPYEGSRLARAGKADVLGDAVIPVRRRKTGGGYEYGDVDGKDFDTALADGWTATSEEDIAAYEADKRLTERGVGPVSRLALNALPILQLPGGRAAAGVAARAFGADGVADTLSDLTEAEGAPLVDTTLPSWVPLIGGRFKSGGAREEARNLALGMSLGPVGRGATALGARAFGAAAESGAARSMMARAVPELAGLAAEGALFGTATGAEEVLQQAADSDAGLEAARKNPGEAVAHIVGSGVLGAASFAALGGALRGVHAGVGATGRGIGGKFGLGEAGKAADRALLRGEENLGQPKTGYVVGENGEMVALDNTMTEEAAIAARKAAQRAQALSGETPEMQALLEQYGANTPLGQHRLRLANMPQETAVTKYASEAKPGLDRMLGEEFEGVIDNWGGSNKRELVGRLTHDAEPMTAVRNGRAAVEAFAGDAARFLEDPALNAPTGPLSRFAAAAGETRAAIEDAIPKKYRPLFEPASPSPAWTEAPAWREFQSRVARGEFTVEGMLKGRESPAHFASRVGADESALFFPPSEVAAREAAEEASHVWAGNKALEAAEDRRLLLEAFQADAKGQAKIAADVFNALDEMKKKLGSALYDARKSAGMPGGQFVPEPLYRMGKSMGENIRALLEGEEFGAAGRAQKLVNEAYAPYRDARRAVRSLVGERGVVDIPIEKMERLLRSAGSAGTEEVQTGIQKALMRLADTSQEVARRVAEVSGKADARAFAEGVAKGADRFRNAFQEGANLVRARRMFGAMSREANATNNVFGRFTPGAKWGGAMGFTTGLALGGPLAPLTGLAGAGIGMLGEAAINPIKKMRWSAQLSNYSHYLMKETNSSAKQFVGHLMGRQFSASYRAATGAKTLTGAASDVGARLGSVGSAIIRATRRPVPSALVSEALRAKYLGAVEVVRAMADKDSIHASLDAGLDGMLTGIPELGEAAGKHLGTVTTWLQEQMPPLPPPDPFSPERRADEDVTRAAAESFVLKVEAALDPRVVFKALRDGDVRPEQAEALKACWPDIFDGIQADVLGEIQKHAETKVVPHSARLRAGALFGVPLTATTQPDFIQAAQAAFMSDDQPDPEEGPLGPGRGAPRGPGMKGYADQFRTQTQRAV